MKKADIIPGERYVRARSRDIFAYRGTNCVVVPVDNVLRYELRGWEIEKTFLDHSAQARKSPVDQRQAIADWKKTATLDQRYPAGGGGEILCKAYDNDGTKTFRYILVPSREIRMTEAEYNVAAAKWDESLRVSAEKRKVREQERAGDRVALEVELDHLGVAYIGSDTKPRGGRVVGDIRVTAWGISTELDNRTLMALLRLARESS